MVPRLSKTYRPSKRSSVRKRQDTIGLRVGFLAAAICVLTFAAKTGVWEKDVSAISKTGVLSLGSLQDTGNRKLKNVVRFLASENYCDSPEGQAFCPDGNCFTPEDFPLTCCLGFPDNVTDAAPCLAEHGHVLQCKLGDLCVAELIPGGGGAAECLQQFEKDFGILLYLFILFYLFLGLAIVCDDYFTVALDKIADGLGVSEDVNGATFAAVGSSAPELFVSLADNVIAQPPKSVGVGTIVGSAIFNILIIIGASAIVAGRKFGKMKLNPRPLARDSSFYVVSILLLIAVVIDGEVEWWEGLILVIGYASYLTFMVYNQRIFTYVDKKLGTTPKTDIAVSGEDSDDVTIKKLSELETEHPGRRRSIAASIGSWRGLEEELYDEKPYFDNLMWPLYESTPEVERSISEKLCGGGGFMWSQRLYFIFVFPLNLIFRFTIPDSEYDLFGEDKPGVPENRKKGYWFEFVMCIFHIAISSHFLVWSAAKFGCLAGIPPAVMGLTILAAGTSVPDAITSIILTRNGKGDGAVANSIGSNVFDILIGLGFPWLLAGLIYGEAAAVAVDDLSLAIGFLFGVLAILLGALFFTKFYLNQFVGFILVALYVFYVLFELFIRPQTSFAT
mmetsp:Transcript_2901/g.3926  ORF Transcript_2901/g.3926 Transcript_2901/m.3926 type:complete len:618 (-) Transcript_2901:126-1979(-)